MSETGTPSDVVQDSTSWLRGLTHLRRRPRGADQPGTTAEARTVVDDGATYAPVGSWFCTSSTCPVIVDNLLVYRENSHITLPYATYLAPGHRPDHPRLGSRP